jgi:hypothetical protein
MTTKLPVVACCAVAPAETAALHARSAPVAQASPRVPTHLAAYLVAAGVVWLLCYVAAEPASAFVAHRLLGLSSGTRLGTAVAFFVYEVPHVLLLLVAVVFAIGVVNTFFTAPARAASSSAAGSWWATAWRHYSAS